MMHFINKTVLLAILVFTLVLTGYAQPPPPSEYGDDENQPAPIGSGIVILLVLAGAYGVKKVYVATVSQIPNEPSV